MIETAPTTTTIATRLPVKIRRVAEVLADEAGSNLSRWAAEAIRQRAERELASADPKRGEIIKA